jgi:pseudaminic acid biosynthesis-associated methylase
MSTFTDQAAQWRGEFGKQYTDRNALSIERMEEMYRTNFGVSRTELNSRFIGGLDRSMRILEVGSNVGNQLLALQKLGFVSLYGVELQDYAVELSKQRSQHINIIQGSAFDIPFKDGFFDLVFTSGVLIHIHPNDIVAAMKEIHRCSRKLIWGFEYFADNYTEVPYRGHANLLWKTDFARLYLDAFSDLRLIKEERIEYKSQQERGKVDSMFLLGKVVSPN